MVMHEVFDVGKRKESSFSRSRRNSESEYAYYAWLLFVICRGKVYSEFKNKFVFGDYNRVLTGAALFQSTLSQRWWRRLSVVMHEVTPETAA